MKRMRGVFLCLLIYPHVLLCKVLVITHSYNRPDFIELQYKTFKKFLRDDYEFVVFNDARDQKSYSMIQSTCRNLNISCIPIPQEIHIGRDNPCERCADVVRYSLDHLGFNYDGKVMIIDSDMFLINDFSIDKALENHVVAGVFQGREHVAYLWNALVLLDMKTLPDKLSFDFNCGQVEGVSVDVGGKLYHYFKKHPEIKPLYINCYHMDYLVCAECSKQARVGCRHNTELLESLHFNARTIQLIQSGVHNIEFLFDSAFIHYRGGGNWDQKSPDYHARKTAFLNEFMSDVLSR